MKSRSLLGIAVAATFGWSVAAHAGSHQTNWVAAGEEQYPQMVMFDGTPTSTLASISSDESIGSTSMSAGGSLSGSYSDDEVSYSGPDDDTLSLADDGVYTDYYLVNWTPVTMDDWDSYVIAPVDYVAIVDDSDLIASSYDVYLFPSDYFGSSEMTVGYVMDDEDLTG